MNVYDEIVLKIIKGQEAIIGPVAVEQAQQVHGLKLDWPRQSVSIKGDEADVIDQLIEKYKDLFGQISVEVSKEAVAQLVSKLPANGMPKTLK